MSGFLDACLLAPHDVDPELNSVVIGGDLMEEGGGDILTTSLAASGILSDTEHSVKPWGDTETDDFLDSILTGSGDKLDCLALPGQNLDAPFSDTSSDSGCYNNNLPTSPGQQSNGLDLVEFISNDDSDDDVPFQAVNPVTNSPPEEETTTTTTITIPSSEKALSSGNVQNAIIQTGTTTIVLPVMGSRQTKLQSTPPPSKRRRISQSSSDSGLDDNVVVAADKYPPLLLNEEEKRLCEREGVRLPSHYPLSREEEKNLKRIRRKIRNKVSAQDSRKRKKEYVDAMEDRVRKCTDENGELHKKIEMLESQNKTLAGQLRRLHQIIVNGGLKTTQPSTAMMVLILSTALFLMPGLKEQLDSKCDLDISQAIKMPPMPGQSRSLLQFAPTTQIKQEYESNIESIKTESDVASAANNVVVVPSGPQHNIALSKPQMDHDYYSSSSSSSRGRISVLSASSPKTSYVEEDAPAEGYGPAKKEAEERRINVTTTGRQGMRTVVLHVPRDIK